MGLELGDADLRRARRGASRHVPHHRAQPQWPTRSRRPARTSSTSTSRTGTATTSSASTRSRSGSRTSRRWPRRRWSSAWPASWRPTWWTASGAGCSRARSPTTRDGRAPRGRLARARGAALIPIATGFTDTADSTSLHVPSLGLVVAGDVVYNGIHPYLGETDAQSRLGVDRRARHARRPGTARRGRRAQGPGARRRPAQHRRDPAVSARLHPPQRDDRQRARVVRRDDRALPRPRESRVAWTGANAAKREAAGAAA